MLERQRGRGRGKGEGEGGREEEREGGMEGERDACSLSYEPIRRQTMDSQGTEACLSGLVKLVYLTPKAGGSRVRVSSLPS